MDSHLDSDSPIRSQVAKMFLDDLEKRAEKIKSMERSKITSGANGEPILAEWTAEGVGVRQLPPDEQGILRISIGGGKNLPVVAVLGIVVGAVLWCFFGPDDF